MAAGIAGVLLVKSIDLVTVLPQGLDAVTLILPDPNVLSNFSVMVLVPKPDKIVAVDGTLHAIKAALVTSSEYVAVSAFGPIYAQAFEGPVSVPTIKGLADILRINVATESQPAMLVVVKIYVPEVV